VIVAFRIEEVTVRELDRALALVRTALESPLLVTLCRAFGVGNVRELCPKDITQFLAAPRAAWPEVPVQTWKVGESYYREQTQVIPS